MSVKGTRKKARKKKGEESKGQRATEARKNTRIELDPRGRRRASRISGLTISVKVAALSFCATENRYRFPCRRWKTIPRPNGLHPRDSRSSSRLAPGSFAPSRTKRVTRWKMRSRHRLEAEQRRRNRNGAARNAAVFPSRNKKRPEAYKSATNRDDYGISRGPRRRRRALRDFGGDPTCQRPKEKTLRDVLWTRANPVSFPFARETFQPSVLLCAFYRQRFSIASSRYTPGGRRPGKNVTPRVILSLHTGEPRRQ